MLRFLLPRPISTSRSKTQQHCPLAVASSFSCSLSPSPHPAGLESPWTLVYWFLIPKSHWPPRRGPIRGQLRLRSPVPFKGQGPPLPSSVASLRQFTLRSVEQPPSPLKPSPLLSDDPRSFRAVVLQLTRIWNPTLQGRTQERRRNVSQYHFSFSTFASPRELGTLMPGLEFPPCHF